MQKYRVENTIFFSKLFLKKCFCGILMLFLLTYPVFSQQTQRSLNKNRIEQRINYLQQLLHETTKSTNISHNQLMLINRKIEEREKMIRVLQDELSDIERQIITRQNKIKSLESELKQIKDEYAKIIYYAYKNRNSYDKLVFILSAKDFNQSYKRLKYLQQYSDYRKKQASFLIRTKGQIEQELVLLTKEKQQKEILHKKYHKELARLSNERLKQNQLVNTLEEKKSSIIKKLNDYGLSNKEIEKNVLMVIEAENNLDEINNAPENTGETLTAAKAQKSGGKKIREKLDLYHFGKNKGRLPWPVKKGVVYNYFGVHPHPFLEGIFIQNNGIDISTEQGAKARAVFNGKVSKIIAIPGGNQAVLLSHGAFYTVYGNLKDINVSPGDFVEAKQQLGTIFTDKADDNRTTLQFQIWRYNKKVDPLYWLFPK